jgi:hypothetical protein
MLGGVVVVVVTGCCSTDRTSSSSSGSRSSADMLKDGQVSIRRYIIGGLIVCHW